MALNDLIYAEEKLVCEKNRDPLEDNWKKVKTWKGTQTWITDKKTTTTSKDTKPIVKKYSGEIEKHGTLNLKKSLWIPTKNTGERRMTKKMPSKSQTIQTKQDVPKQRKKFYQQWMKPYQKLKTREAKRFWSKLHERKDHDKKAEWINNKKFLKVNIRPDELKARL